MTYWEFPVKGAMQVTVDIDSDSCITELGASSAAETKNFTLGNIKTPATDEGTAAWYQIKNAFSQLFYCNVDSTVNFKISVNQTLEGE